jgi:transposase
LTHGLDSLKYGTSSGRPPKLTKTQRRQLKEVILKGPQAAGFEVGCWNTLMIQEYIEREWEVVYNRRYLSALLQELGLSYQKARFVSDHLDEDTRREWKEQTWPEILRWAKKEGAWLLFEDEASFAQWGSLGYTWALAGHQPTVPTSGKRKGYKVFGAIDYWSGRVFWRRQEGRFNSTSYQAFLRQILRSTSGPVFLIQDGARYHTSQAMKDFFQDQADRLTVFPLPSYSPDFNPIERVWKKVKGRVHNRYFGAFDDLKKVVNKALDYMRQHPQEVLSVMKAYLVESDLAVAA